MEINNALMWFDFADQDLDTAQLLIQMRPTHFEIICYHCEQAAEKYLKGYLVAHGTFPPKTHELEKLCAMCSETDNQFNEIVATCSFLTQFATQMRYPHEMNITEEHVKLAISNAESIKNFAPIISLRKLLS
ncbi:MAG: HEPN domain-containing protein [Planctomycetaceae bacterium]|jgi:HEPN domain-containing protein|nr:HEPN domain-containing protein [Planctomycetaceae bacterium]